MKVAELAKKLKLSDTDLLKFLSDLNIRVKSRSSKLDIQTVKMVRELYLEQNKEDEQVIQERTVIANFESLSIRDLVDLLDVKVVDVMGVLMEKKLLLTINSTINRAQAIELAAALHITIQQDEKDPLATQHVFESESDTVRPPVITVMGHVDHGKTLLLDKIRKTNILNQEAGSITQHIGAYQALSKGRTFTFLDTPGHAVFSALRLRGVRVTDIVILVVAADDGVKPQTIEAINHAKVAKVPIIVAINKTDKPEANIDQVKQQLSEHEILSEEWGGEVVMVPISAKTGDGIENLLDMIQLTAEVLELTADPIGFAKGVIIESRLSKQKGTIGTVLIQSGSLKVGHFFVVDSIFGKVRAIINDVGDAIDVATPGMPVEILGFSDMPRAGSLFSAFLTEKEAKNAIQIPPKETSQATLHVTGQSEKHTDTNELHVIIKADTQGSVDAIKQLIAATNSIKITIVRATVGNIVQDDIHLASVAQALIIGFGVSASSDIQEMAQAASIDIRLYTVIYKAIDDMETLIKGRRVIEYEKKEMGHAEIRKVYQYSKWSIAGVYVLEGKLQRNKKAVLIRNGKECFAGNIDSLKRFKDDVTNVDQGFECGVVMKGASFQEGDKLIVYELIEKEE